MQRKIPVCGPGTQRHIPLLLLRRGRREGLGLGDVVLWHLKGSLLAPERA